MDFDEWLRYGIENGYCTEQVCAMHDAIPVHDQEWKELDNGFDPCMMVVRLGSYDDWAIYGDE